MLAPGGVVLPAIIEAEGLTKSYKDVHALSGLDLTIPKGTVFGLLGPNGAGKTTAVSILTTLIKPDSGSASVAGVDVRKRPQDVRAKIGLSGQYAAVDEYLTAYENLDMIGRLYHLNRKASQQRARELLAQFDLTDAADRPVRGYSGGMRRRLDLAGALVARPPVIFLDEPTTGLDPRSRMGMWQVIESLVADGATLLLTTQYLEEADRLADEIMVIDNGKAIAQGTAESLKAQVGGERIEVRLADGDRLDDARSVLAPFSQGEMQIDVGRRTILAPSDGGAPIFAKALVALDGANIEILDVALRRPTLDDVFLTLTGHHAEADTAKHSDDGETELTNEKGAK